MKATAIIAVLLAVVAAAVAMKSYNLYKVARINVKTVGALEDLQKILGPTLDCWSNDGRLGINIDNDILLTPKEYEQLTFYMQKRNTNPSEFGPASVKKFEVLHENVQDLIEAEAKANNAVSEDDDYFKKYHKFDDVVAYLKKLHEENKEITSIFKIGESWEHREILGFKIAIDDKPKPQFYFDGLVHAREWIGAAVVQYALTTFIQKYKAGDARITSILNKYNIVFVPVVNPDGYEFTFTKDRMWRKNRRNNGLGTHGVDLNRNFQLGWGVGASSIPISITYKGPSPLSEPESHSILDYLKATANITKAGIDFHSYSQLVLRPWAYNRSISDQETRFAALGGHLVQAINDTHGENYKNIRGVQLYPAGGVLGDQFYGVFMYPGFTIELRDTGRYGFSLPPNQIIPCSEENLAAILALIEHVDDKY